MLKRSVKNQICVIVFENYYNPILPKVKKIFLFFFIFSLFFLYFFFIFFLFCLVFLIRSLLKHYFFDLFFLTFLVFCTFTQSEANARVKRSEDNTYAFTPFSSLFFFNKFFSHDHSLRPSSLFFLLSIF